jgi:hypothetical protein
MLLDILKNKDFLKNIKFHKINGKGKFLKSYIKDYDGGTFM